ncbi:hypothetical protein B0T11DRAFT_328026 [Plectosphaerella cucumerina]|uniref:Uncharacterized protein n=1 Tax=Plectosphaerella cucumerina TaxID=40658 RepID=A0A8K0X3Z1_9PEZI|nr:hypothetical protein B0T11DRAFT_328026 [Plectosphaerella cucumerina]
MSPFQQLPAELIGAICKAITEDDIDDRESLATLANLARVCKALSESAQRTLFEHEKHVGQPLRYCYGLRTGNLDAVKTAIRLGWKPGQRIMLCCKVLTPAPSHRRMYTSPIHIASTAGHLHIVRHLVKPRASANMNADKWSRWIHKHSMEPYTVQKLKRDERLGWKKPEVFIRPSESWPEMHFSANRTTPDGVVCSEDYTPLRLALINGHEEVAAYLIERMTNLNNTDLLCAVQNGRCKPLQLMFDGGMEPTDGMLFSVAKLPHAARVAALLLKAGADPNATGSFENHSVLRELGINHNLCHLTILGYACFLGAYDLAHVLLDHGADASIGQAWIWQQCLHGYARTRETARLLDRMIKAGLDVNHLETRCEMWESMQTFMVNGIPGLFAGIVPPGVFEDDSDDEDMESDDEDSSDDGWGESDNIEEEAEAMDVDGGQQAGANVREDLNTDGFGLPLFRHCMDDFGDGARGFIQTRQLDIARTLLKHGASMAVPEPANTRYSRDHKRRGEKLRVFPQHKDKEPTHHAPRCSLYDSLETGSVLWFWALCRQQFNLCDLLREYGAPVPQTDDELKLTVLMAFNGRRMPKDKFPRYPHIDPSEFPTRATFGDTVRGRFMGPHYRENILDYLTSTIAPADSWLRNQEARDSWLEEYEFGFLTAKALEEEKRVVRRITCYGGSIPDYMKQMLGDI